MLKIYTDGSCCPNPGKGGWAFIALTSPEIVRHGMEEVTTNNKMELTAVIQALKTFPTENLHIYTDSQLTMKCATNEWKRNKNKDLWKIFDSVTNTKKRQITFEWVKAHNGDKYNEKVDKLAKLKKNKVD